MLRLNLCAFLSGDKLVKQYLQLITQNKKKTVKLLFSKFVYYDLIKHSNQHLIRVKEYITKCCIIS